MHNLELEYAKLATAAWFCLIVASICIGYEFGPVAGVGLGAALLCLILAMKVHS